MFSELQSSQAIEMIEYCCESHKTVASKRRRQRAHQLYQMGISVEEAKAEIGEAYSISVEKWYGEAARYAHPCLEGFGNNSNKSQWLKERCGHHGI